jgi:hypothetical protein
MSEIAKHWIDGEWTGSGTISESVNPATGAVLGQWADGGEAGLIAGQNGQQGVGHLVRGHQRDTRGADQVPDRLVDRGVREARTQAFTAM